MFFECSLIEYIGRECKLKRADVVNTLGEEHLRRIYRQADILHCEPIEKTANVYEEMCGIKTGSYDNIANCKYDVPDYWTIGDVYRRLIEDSSEGDVVKTLIEVYNSWISDAISNYNSDFFYQSREYIYECYKQGEVLE